LSVALLAGLGLWLAASEDAPAKTEAETYNSSTWGKIVEFAVSTDYDESSDITLRCSACSIMATQLEDVYERQTSIYKDFKNWDRQTRIAKLTPYLQRGCDEVRKMKIAQHGNTSERIYEDYYAIMSRGGTKSVMAYGPKSSAKLGKICDNYVKVDLPDLVDRMSSYIEVVVDKKTQRKQRIVDFKFREEICIEQLKLCGLKNPKAQHPNAQQEEFDWEWDEDKEEL